MGYEREILSRINSELLISDDWAQNNEISVEVYPREDLFYSWPPSVDLSVYDSPLKKDE